MRHIYLSLKMLLLLLLCNSAVAQQGNVWVFGYHSGLDFNTVPPTPITTAIQAPNLPNYKASKTTAIADCSGKLLFYGTNGEVFNRKNKVMPNGTFNNCSRSEMEAYALPMPGDSTKYYYFYSVFYRQVNFPCKTSGLFYSIIDMTLDSGYGDIMPGYKNIHLPLNRYNALGNFAIVPHTNKKDFWLVACDQPDSMFVYSITEKGIGPRKVYPLAKRNEAYLSGGDNKIRFSHKGDKFFFFFNDRSYTSVEKLGFAIHDFLPDKGMPGSKYQFFSARYANFDPLKPYISSNDVEFSANDSFFYANGGYTTWPERDSYSGIYQFETYAPDVMTTKVVILEEKNSQAPVNSLQLGPDNKMYLSRYYGLNTNGGNKLDVIHNPNKKGKACNPELGAVDLGTGTMDGYFPSIYTPIRHLSFKQDATCKETATFKNLSDTIYFRSLQWQFGDGNSSTLISPKYTYKKSGRYKVTLTGTNKCGAKLTYSDTVDVTIPPKASFSIYTFYYSCGKAHIKVTSTAKDITSSIFDFGDNSKPDSALTSWHVYDSSAKFIIKQTVADSFCSGATTQNIIVNIEQAPKANFTISDTVSCVQKEITFTNQSIFSKKQIWLFSDGATDTSFSPKHIFTDTGKHSITLITSNNQGCSDTFSKIIYLGFPPKAAFSIENTKLCISNPTTKFNNQSIFWR